MHSGASKNQAAIENGYNTATSCWILEIAKISISRTYAVAILAYGSAVLFFLFSWISPGWAKSTRRKS
jgi:hypothetical protein